jgi:hypothetical protein
VCVLRVAYLLYYFDTIKGDAKVKGAQRFDARICFVE